MRYNEKVNPRRAAALLLGVVLAWGGGGAASGQTILFTPSLSISEEFDDNIAASATDPQSDLITAVRPGLRLEIRDHPWYVTLAGSLTGEFFAKRSEFNNTTDNMEGSATGEYRARRFSISLTDTFIRSVNTFDVAPEAGIIGGRPVSTSNAVTPAVTYQVNPLTSARVQYSFRTLESDSPLSRDSNTHEAAFSVQRQLTRTLSGSLAYSYTRFHVEGSPDRDSHSPRLGLATTYWPTVQLSSTTGLIFLEQADGSTQLTLGSSTRYEQEFQRGRLSLAYDRNAGVAGVIGVASVSQILSAAGSLQAARDLTVGVDSSLTDTSTADSTVDLQVYAAGIRVTYRLLRWLSIEASYRYQRQNDRAGTRDLQRNIFFLGITASDQFRAY